MEKNIEEERLKKIKGLIFSKGYTMKEIADKFGFKSYEGFKKAIRFDRKGRYEEVLKFLTS